MMGAGVSLKETCSVTRLLASPKSIIMRGTWNVKQCTPVQDNENSSCNKRD